MKTLALLGLYAALLTVLACRKSFPETYGIYADTRQGRLNLSGQMVVQKGTILNLVFGVNGPSGPACSSLDHFIIYQKDVAPHAIRLAKMTFQEEVSSPSIFSPGSRSAVNLWVPTSQIELGVRPIEERPDMYIAVPKTPLESGFYSLYIGAFGGALGWGGPVYDIVVGSLNDYPSYDAKLLRLRTEAVTLIKRLNQLLNQGQYDRLKDVYRPNGQALTQAELDRYIAGNRAWLISAGMITESAVEAVMPYDSHSFECSITTTYTKLGAQSEKMTFANLDGHFYITKIQ